MKCLSLLLMRFYSRYRVLVYILIRLDSSLWSQQTRTRLYYPIQTLLQYTDISHLPIFWKQKNQFLPASIKLNINKTWESGLYCLYQDAEQNFFLQKKSSSFIWISSYVFRPLLKNIRKFNCFFLYFFE